VKRLTLVEWVVALGLVVAAFVLMSQPSRPKAIGTPAAIGAPDGAGSKVGPALPPVVKPGEVTIEQ
jgi:hypothetical protein